jgi:ATP adenylyltransferase/5',5'''-P-1,P-4-tetraphosphate phosphorylase II
MLEDLVRQLVEMSGQGVEGIAEGTPLSYNVTWTKDYVMVVPRSKEKEGPCAIK